MTALAVSGKPDLESDGKAKAASTTAQPQQPIPGVTTDLASTAASTKGVGKHLLFQKMLIFFFLRKCRQLISLYILLIYSGLCAGLSSSFTVLPSPSTGPGQQEDRVSPNARQMSAS